MGVRRRRGDRRERARAALLARSVHDRGVDRRARRGGRRALTAPMRRDTVRRFALTLPEAEERETWDTATFRVRDRIFMMFSEQERHAWVKSTHDEQRALVSEDPDTF